METITRGSGSRVGFVLVDEKRYFFVEKTWKDNFQAWTIVGPEKKKKRCIIKKKMVTWGIREKL